MATGLQREETAGGSKTHSWESEIADFLNDLSLVQGETLEVLALKRECLAKVDTEGLAALAEREQLVIGRLEECLRRRAQLLQRAEAEGLPGGSIQSLARALPGGGRKQLSDQVNQATGRTRLLRHHSLTNWVIAQRTLLHLSQMVEIIATGGKKRPTYSKDGPREAGGALVDRVA